MKNKEIQSALAGEITIDEIFDIQSKIERNSELIDEIVNTLVAKYCSELDAYMSDINALLTSDDPATPLELDAIIMNLPVLIYFTSEAQESLGIKEDVAKAVRMDKYNRSYSQQAGTIPAKQAAAELQVQNEIIAHMAYSRAYKKIKERLEAAYEMLNSVKKVISRRMQEKEINNSDPNVIK